MLSKTKNSKPLVVLLLLALLCALIVPTVVPGQVSATVIGNRFQDTEGISHPRVWTPYASNPVISSTELLASPIGEFYYHKKLKFDTDTIGVDTNQTNFPICVDINSSSWPTTAERTTFFGSWNVNGKRVQFFDSDGTTNLDYEVELYNTTSLEITQEVFTTTPVGGKWEVPVGVYHAEVLVVAGGGGGGGYTGGGGGAGGVILNRIYRLIPGEEITVTVGSGGAGGIGGVGDDNGKVGGNSVFGTMTAAGGGYGSRNSTQAGDGGSGGGAGAGLVPPGLHGHENQTPNQGYDGGDGGDVPKYGAGGGGGAGAVGNNGTTTGGGVGGTGVDYSLIYGTSVGELGWFAGGGGGGSQGAGVDAAGGNGGGGDAPFGDGLANTGGGGAGSHDNSTTQAGDGGSGVVIVKYAVVSDNPEAIYWVKVPSVTGNSTTDYIWCAYGNDPNGTAQDNPTGVWTNYKTVFHLSTDKVWKNQGIVLDPPAGIEVLEEATLLYDTDPQVIAGTNVFKLWYTVYDSTEGTAYISYAESLDAISWTVYGEVLSDFASASCVFRDTDDTYYMYVNEEAFLGICRYSSDDGIAWVLDDHYVVTVGESGQWDATAIASVDVWKEGVNDWRMTYSGYGLVYGWSTGYATSSDGLSWSKSVSNPVLTNYPLTYQIGGQTVKKVGSTYYMWYHEFYTTTVDFHVTVGMATSTNLINWTRSPVNERYTPVWYTQTASEGVGFGDPSICEANGKTYIIGQGSVEAEFSTLSVYVADMTLAQLVATTQNAVVDSTTNSYKASNYRMPSVDTGVVDGGFIFNSTKSEFISVTSPAMDFGTAGLSISVWIKALSSTSPTKIVYRQSTGDSNDPLVRLELSGVTAHKATFAVRGKTNPTSYPLITGGTTVDNSVFHHIAGVFDDANGTGDLYVDGVSDAVQLTSKTTTDVDFSGGNFSIGRYSQDWGTPDFGQYFNGVIDEVRLSNSAFSADYIKLEYYSMLKTNYNGYSWISWDAAIAIAKVNGILKSAIAKIFGVLAAAIKEINGISY